ncbi:alpha/beta-hydrolase [Mycena olivaceomarginata]|nr:alpha/beta-hydrolase [Mycena olivaceomarginata]
MSPRLAPYGNWISPITASAVAAQNFLAGVEEVILDPVTSKVYFAQKRPEENGRSAVVDASSRRDLFDESWDARTQLHEYGGAAATVYNGVLYFSHILDHRVYKADLKGDGVEPTAITPVNPVTRFADFTVHPKHPDLIVCSVEDHTDPHPARVLTYLVLIDAENKTVSRLVEGADFYACARFSPDGNFLAPPGIALAKRRDYFGAGDSRGRKLKIGNTIHVAGKTGAIAAQDPNWASNNTIFFTCDVSGYHNPWKFIFDPSDPVAGKASPILREPIAEEFGAPQWFLSRHGSGALSESKVAFVSFSEGCSVLHICDLITGDIRTVSRSFAHIQYLRGDGRGKVVMLGQPADAGEALIELMLDNDGNPQIKTLSPPAVENPELPSSYISAPKYFALTLPPDNRTCHINYYPPKNPNYDGGLPGEKPPVVVLVHGGPWYMETANLDWTKQFFTSRGWAHIDVNYGGSTGFGRAFRESLQGKWGLLDIEDAYQSVLKLDALGLVDAQRAVVHGGSAGGYSVLQLATDLPTAFRAGAPHYGVSDMRKLDEVLHKFEYYLCDRLMGGTWEECEPVWRARSPIYHADKILMPLLILQGEDDTVVPADQMVEMVKKIKERKGKVDLVLFPGEGHGWRKASTVQTVLEREMVFFNEVLGLENTHSGEKALNQ